MKTSLQKYVKELLDAGQITDYSISDKENTRIEHITFHSQQARENTLFICKGAHFKKQYLKEALFRGAVCYISEQRYPLPNLSYILVKDVQKAMSLIARKFYNTPQASIYCTGVTGTKGKTTTAYYIKSILDTYMESQNKKNTALISSIENYDGKCRIDSLLTTPESIQLHEHLYNAVRQDITHMTVEVSSQALKYHRVHDLAFHVGVFLNISEDHISPTEHQDFNDYFAAKLSLFRQSKIACINLDSQFAAQVLSAAQSTERIITFGTKKGADIQAANIKMNDGRVSFDVNSDRFHETIELAMPGRFNMENALAAIAATYAYNIPVDYMIKGLASATVNGRMERYFCKKRNITAIVDYAHNRLSYEKLYESVLSEYPNHEIITVFGCPGNKALNRRKELGTIAGTFSNKIFLSADDPGTESVQSICEEIGTYIRSVSSDFVCIENRESAIRKAILEAPDNSVVLVLGKGNETFQKYGNYLQSYPSDAEVVRQSILVCDK